VAEEKTNESEGLEKVLLSLADKAAKKTTKEGSKGSSFVVYIILTAVISLGFALLGWKAVRAKRKSAQLEYELRVQEEEKIRLAEDAKLSKNATDRDAAIKTVGSLSIDIAGIKDKLETNEAKAKERAILLAKVAGWEELTVVNGKKD
jgi:hypothetical protein